MPKMKSHTGAKKRFKITGTGRVLRDQAFRGHNFETKPSTRTRRLARQVEVVGGDRARAKRLLGR
jgi:large subunit ribosomal protein L35